MTKTVVFSLLTMLDSIERWRPTGKRKLKGTGAHLFTWTISTNKPTNYNVVDKISILYIWTMSWTISYTSFFKFNYFLFTADCSVPKAPDNVVCSGRITRLKILTVTLLLLYLLISNLRNILMKCKSTYKKSI